MADAKKKRKRGAKSKLTAEVIKAITTAIRAGSYFGPACEYAGIAESTGYMWLQIARGEHPEGEATKLHLEFLEAIKKAEADAEAAAALRIQKAARGGEVVSRHTKITTKTITRRNGDVEEHVIEDTKEDLLPPQWQADAWWLERKFKDRWGRKELAVKAELTGKDGGPMQVEGGGQVIVLLPSNGRDDGPAPVTEEDMPVQLPGNGREDDGHDAS